MDDLRRRRSVWLDGRRSRSKRAAEKPQRWSFTLNRCRSFFHRLFSGSSDGLTWQLRPISPDYVTLPRYKLLSRSETEMSLWYKPKRSPENHHQGGFVKEMKTVRNDDKIEGDGNKDAKLQSVTNSVKYKKWHSWLPDPQRRWPVQGW